MSSAASTRHRGRLVQSLLVDVIARRLADIRRSGVGAAGLRDSDGAESADETTIVRVLDCGGGTGALAVPLAVAGAYVTVVDRSVDALAILSRRAGEAGVGDRVFAVPGDLDAGDLGLPNTTADARPQAAFDLVVAHDVLTAVRDPDATIAAVADRVVPGGWLSVQVVNAAALVLGRALAGDVVGARRALTTPTRGAYDLPTLTALVTTLGLRCDSAHGIGVLTEYVSGPDLEAHDVGSDDVAALDDELAARSPYREIASRVHILARRPDAGDADDARGTADRGA